ncbi:rod shape-determining protein MreD [Flavobacteriales bacterium]|jgi:rod shape-determining protein MreD|nr:rod shape-determining protein MreD [Flavobacteriales bacterium]MDC3395251.1 rod shape-determining protein MreD [Flavobacteriales bacterium]
MSSHFIKYLGLLPIYVLLQVLVLNEVLFSAYINPFLYVLLIISLPLKTPKWFLLIYAFLLGFAIDLFSGSLGFHSTATVLIAFVKPLFSKITIPHNILGDSDEITLKKVGTKSYITFSILLIIIHHSCLFITEHLSINFSLFGKVLASSFVTLIIVLITQLFQQDK